MLVGARRSVIAPYLLDGSETDGTNLISSGGDGFTTGWSVDASALSAAQAMAPDGTLTAASLVENSATSRHILYRQPGSVDFSVNRTFSVYAKPALGTRYLEIYIARQDSAANRIWAYADFYAGVISAFGSAGTGVLNNYRIRKAKNGFWKVAINGSLGSTNNPFLQFNLSDRNTNTGSLTNDIPSWAGDNASGIYLWRPRFI